MLIKLKLHAIIADQVGDLHDVQVPTAEQMSPACLQHWALTATVQASCLSTDSVRPTTPNCTRKIPSSSSRSWEAVDRPSLCPPIAIPPELTSGGICSRVSNRTATCP